jgi:hypothetical protein
MSQYFCPLCKQTVSRALYEKITGVWQEKEEKLASLRAKEKQLVQKEKELRTMFADEKKKLLESGRQRLATAIRQKEREWRTSLEKEREALRREKEAAEAAYKRKLARETNKALREERAKAKAFRLALKASLAAKAEKTLKKERKVLLRERNALQRQERIQQNKYKMLNIQYSTLQSKSKIDQERAAKKIQALEEQLKKDKTPQVLGLLEEGVFLEKLKAAFPWDRFDHTGKGGDIVHHIMDRSLEVGTIVYELKKVTAFNKAHITQAFDAKNERNADYGILVTNAKRSKDDFGFSVCKGVIIIHPAGALVLINIIRDHLISIAKLKLSVDKRRKTLQAVLDYIQGPTFKNGIEAIIEDTTELYASLNREVHEHIKGWEFRFNKYCAIRKGAYIIDSRVIRLLDEEAGRRAETVEGKLVPITLPARID